MIISGNNKSRILTDTIYDGDYKITDMNISFGENYEMDFNMIRIPEEEEEEA